MTDADFTNTLEEVSVGGKKTWTDENNKYGTRPSAAEFRARLTLGSAPAVTPGAGTHEFVWLSADGTAVLTDTDVDELTGFEWR